MENQETGWKVFTVKTAKNSSKVLISVFTIKRLATIEECSHLEVLLHNFQSISTPNRIDYWIENPNGTHLHKIRAAASYDLDTNPLMIEEEAGFLDNFINFLRLSLLLGDYGFCMKNVARSQQEVRFHISIMRVDLLHASRDTQNPLAGPDDENYVPEYATMDVSLQLFERCRRTSYSPLYSGLLKSAFVCIRFKCLVSLTKPFKSDSTSSDHCSREALWKVNSILSILYFG